MSCWVSACFVPYVPIRGSPIFSGQKYFVIWTRKYRTAMLSRNFGHQSLSDTAPHPGRKTSDAPCVYISPCKSKSDDDIKIRDWSMKILRGKFRKPLITLRESSNTRHTYIYTHTHIHTLSSQHYAHQPVLKPIQPSVVGAGYPNI
jgi:hypothetical protein